MMKKTSERKFSAIRLNYIAQSCENDKRIPTGNADFGE